MDELSNNLQNFQLCEDKISVDKENIVDNMKKFYIDHLHSNSLDLHNENGNNDKKQWLDDSFLENCLETTLVKKLDGAKTDGLDGMYQYQMDLSQIFTCSYTIVNARRNNSLDENVCLAFGDLNSVGSGSFGVVYSALLCEKTKDLKYSHFTTPCIVAIKKILQDKRYKNRELSIMKSLNHENIVKLLFYFLSSKKASDVYLNLIMEYLPFNLHTYISVNQKSSSALNFILIKSFTRQIFVALNYLHQLSICHRDIKPHNILVDPNLSSAKICDFGSAKILKMNEDSVSYICSRYYRAPELILGCKRYSFKIDVWSAGCVIAEMLLGRPIFAGSSSVDQLVEIIKILGTPNRDDLTDLNDEFLKYELPSIKPITLINTFLPSVPFEIIEILQETLSFKPSKRPTAEYALKMNYLK